MTIKEWHIRLWENESRGVAGCAVSAARAAVIAGKEFSANNCVMRASTLTFYTLLSIVPLLAVVFGIAKGFGLQPILQRLFAYQAGWQHDLAASLLSFSSAALINARGGLIAGSGVIALFFSIVGMLGAIEAAFNTIWKVDEGRGIARRVADYLSMVIIGTVLLAVSFGVSVFVTAYVQFVAQKISFLAPVSRTLLCTLNILPFIVNWFLFAFIYLFMPNTAVPFSAGVIAGIIAGTVFQAAQALYTGFQTGVSHYGAIYGGFAALPLFLVWLQMSWIIVLWGGELSYAIGNRRTYGFYPEYGRTSVYLRKAVAAAVVEEVARAFVSGKKALTAGEICPLLRVPRQLFLKVARELTAAGIISEITGPRGGHRAYQPALPPERLSPASVFRVFERAGVSDIPATVAPSVKKAMELLDRIEARAGQA